MGAYDVWGIDPDVAARSSRKFSMTHGMFAGVPIICKDSICPYVDVCTVDPGDRIVGSRCPMEAGAIVERFNAWCRHFKIDIDGSSIKDSDLADVSLIKDLVELEVQILRAENRIALNGDFLGQTIVQIDNKGKVYRERTVTPEAEYKMNLHDKKHKVLQLLNATRKDKAKELDLKSSPSEQALTIFKKIQESLNVDVESIDFDKVEMEEQSQDQEV